MEHVYSKFHKRGNVNIPRAKVGRRVFGGLFEAENYCTAHGLNADDWIEYGDSEDLKKDIQDIARMQKPILAEVRERLEARKEELRREMELCRKNVETCHYLERGYWEGRCTEAGAMFREVCTSLHTVFEVNETLEKLTGWKD